MAEIAAAHRTPDALDAAEREAMWDLFAAHYDAVDKDRFSLDLNEKDGLLLLRDAGGVVRGFSTYKLIDGEDGAGPARFLYSGDTIIDPAFWGRTDFARAWIRRAGAIFAAASAPLYWFLIVKGHRTFRFLPLFARKFIPYTDDRDEMLYALRDRIAAARFGADYDRKAGVVRFARSQGQLKPDLAEAPAKDRARPDVAFFLNANPGYVRGEELVCLCPLMPDNLRPIARRAFVEGMADTQDAAGRF